MQPGYSAQQAAIRPVRSQSSSSRASRIVIVSALGGGVDMRAPVRADLSRRHAGGSGAPRTLSMMTSQPANEHGDGASPRDEARARQYERTSLWLRLASTAIFAGALLLFL